MSECVFCQVIREELRSYKLWEDDDFLAFLDIKPINPGHTLLIPKSHNPYIFDLEPSVMAAMFERARFLSEPLRKVNKAKRVGIMVEGFTVPHVHVHLVPIHTGTDLDPNNANHVSEGELTSMASKIRIALANH